MCTIKRSLSGILLLLYFSVLHAQNNIGIGNLTPDSSAKLDIQSTNQGLLIPRLTAAQRNAMPKKSVGLLVYDIDKQTIMMYNGTEWMALMFGNPADLPPSYQKPSNEVAGQFYGCAVSMSDNWMAVGAFGYHTMYEYGEYGAVYMYERINGSWTFRQLLEASDRANGDRFGFSVGLSGNALVVGASMADVDGKVDAGAAYAFRYNGNSWVQEYKMTASNKADYDYFGHSVGLDGVLAVVGAPGKDYVNTLANTTKYEKGAVYIWRYASFLPGWVEDYKWTYELGPDSCRYGSSVSISGSYAAIGAPGTATSKGFVEIKYKNSNPEWAFTQAVNPINSSPNGGLFGSAVSIKGAYLAVGAPKEENYLDGNPIPNAGRAYVFKADYYTNWTYYGDVKVQDLEPGGGFGSSVAIASAGASGDFLVAGSPGKTISGNQYAGEGYIFKLASINNGFSQQWQLYRKMADGTNLAGNRFGIAAAIGTTQAAIGGSEENFANGKIATTNLEK